MWTELLAYLHKFGIYLNKLGSFHAMPIYNISVKEVRWGAVYPDMFVPMPTIEGNFPCLRAKSVHFVAHAQV